MLNWWVDWEFFSVAVGHVDEGIAFMDSGVLVLDTYAILNASAVSSEVFKPHL